MATAKTDREIVREFFEWKWPAPTSGKLKKGIGIAAASLIFVGLIEGAARSDFWLATIIFWNVVILFGVFLIYDHYKSSDLLRKPVGKHLQRVHDSKVRDLAKIWQRSFGKIGKNIAELRQFDLVDYHPLDGARIDFNALARSSAPLAEIMGRSVCLFGPVFPVQDGTIQIGVSRDGVTVEFNPVSVAILYIAGNQLIVYRTIADMLTGDLRSESIQRIYLPQIVQVGLRTDSRRDSNADLLKMFNTAHSLAVTELILSETLVHITMTDGRSLELPIGAISVQDGAKGELDRDEASENRDARIARALDQNIEAAKRLLIAGRGRGMEAGPSGQTKK